MELEAFRGNRARDHVDVLDAFAILRDGISGQQRLQRLGNVLGRQAQRAGTVLVYLEPDRLHLLAPIEVRVDDLGVCRHHLAHLFGDCAHFHRIGPEHAELHGEANWRAEQETIDPRASFGERALGNHTFEPRLDALAGREILGDNDDLGEVRVRQHRVEPEPEPWRALSHIGCIGHDIRIAGEEALGPLCARVGYADRRAFRQPQLEEQLRPRRGREELLLDQAEPADRADEHQYRDDNDGLAPAQAPSDYAAQCAIDAAVIDCVRVLMDAELGKVGQ